MIPALAYRLTAAGRSTTHRQGRAPLWQLVLAFALAMLILTSAASAQGRHADPDLEALLPGKLGGVVLVVESQAGTDLATGSAAFDKFLSGLGNTRADFVVASAYAQGGLKAAAGAWRVKGADTAALLPAFKATVQTSSATPLATAEETVAGKQVTRIGDPGQMALGSLYVFVRGDALYFVQTPDPALAVEALQKLPR
jgi:hypothetical protein